MYLYKRKREFLIIRHMNLIRKRVIINPSQVIFLFCSLSNYLLCQKQLLKDNLFETTLLSYAILQLFFLLKKSLTSRIAYLYFRICLPNKTLSFCWRERYRRQMILFAARPKATLGKKKVAATSKPPFLFLKLRF